LLKVSDVPVKPKSLDVNTWDFKKDNPNKDAEILTLSMDERVNLELSCETAGYYMNGGSKYCTVYLAVECTGPCIYKI